MRLSYQSICNYLKGCGKHGNEDLVGSMKREYETKGLTYKVSVNKTDELK